MSADIIVFTVLTSTPAAMTALGGRIYVDALPDSAAVPAAVVSLVDGIPIQGIHHETGWWRSRVQVDVYCSGRGQVETAADAVQNALRRYRGVVGAYTVDDLMLDAERMDFSPEAETRLFSMDFIVIYKE